MAKIVESSEATYIRSNLDAFECALNDAKLDPTAPLRKQFGADWRTALLFLGVQASFLRSKYRASRGIWFLVGALSGIIFQRLLLRGLM